MKHKKTALIISVAAVLQAAVIIWIIQAAKPVSNEVNPVPGGVNPTPQASV